MFIPVSFNVRNLFKSMLSNERSKKQFVILFSAILK